MRDLLRHAEEPRYAVGYFEAWNPESLLAVKECRGPLSITIRCQARYEKWLTAAPSSGPAVRGILSPPHANFAWVRR